MERTFLFNYEIPIPQSMRIRIAHPTEVEKYVDDELQKRINKSVEENNIESDSVNIIDIEHYQRQDVTKLDLSVIVRVELIANVKPELNEIETFIENLETLKIN